MKVSVLTTILALCLLAFVTNVNSEVNSAEIDDNNSQFIGEIDNDFGENNKHHQNHENNQQDNNDSRDNSDLNSSEKHHENSNHDENNSQSQENNKENSKEDSGDEDNSKDSHEDHKDSNEGDHRLPGVIDLPHSDKVNIEDVHRYIKDSLYLAEQMIISAFETVTESTTAQEKVQQNVIDIIAMINQQMIEVVNTISESKVVIEKPMETPSQPEHNQYQHRFPHFPHLFGPHFIRPLHLRPYLPLFREDEVVVEN